MDKFASQIKTGSLAVYIGDGEIGLAWVKKFIGASSGCTIDVIAIHWYGDANDFG